VESRQIISLVDFFMIFSVKFLPLINIVWIATCAMLVAYGEYAQIEGYSLIAFSVLIYGLFANAIYFAARRRIRREGRLWPELALFGLTMFMGNSIAHSTEGVLAYCALDCFGVDTLFFDRLFLALAGIAFMVWIASGTHGRQRIIGLVVSVIIFALFGADQVSRIYGDLDITELVTHPYAAHG
jgi:hypothetical protein